MQVHTRCTKGKAGLFLLFIMLCLYVPQSVVAQTKGAPEGDCASCHEEAHQTAVRDQGKHKSILGCADCHPGHPPGETNVTVECTTCHLPESAKHFTVGNCYTCHNPHSTMEIKYTHVYSKRICITCHDAVNAEMGTAPSSHSKLSCTMCHRTHKATFDCLRCHKPHTEHAKYEDCLGCHKAHIPTAISFKDQVSSSLCVGCHEKTAAVVSQKGGKHKTKTNCVDCHRVHGSKGIPKCSDCHSPKEKSHFQEKNCTKCHDPHAPTPVNLKGLKKAKPICVSCHKEQDTAMRATPNAHAEQDCTLCHQQHGAFLKCLECHSSHTDGMTYADCLKCHDPHVPTVIRYKNGEVSPDFCANCHKEPTTDIEQHGARHKSEVSCTDCHQKHGKDGIPQCVTCHAPDSSQHFTLQGCTSLYKDVVTAIIHISHLQMTFPLSAMPKRSANPATRNPRGR